MRSREFDVLGRVVATVPVRRLIRPADPSRIFDLCEAIVADTDIVKNSRLMNRMVKKG
jgi:hypothetical protein